MLKVIFKSQYCQKRWVCLEETGWLKKEKQGKFCVQCWEVSWLDKLNTHAYSNTGSCNNCRFRRTELQCLFYGLLQGSYRSCKRSSEGLKSGSAFLIGEWLCVWLQLLSVVSLGSAGVPLTRRSLLCTCFSGMLWTMVKLSVSHSPVISQLRKGGKKNKTKTNKKQLKR